MSAERYERPQVIASFSIDELREDAAAASVYPSDARLKTGLAPVERSLERLGRLARD